MIDFMKCITDAEALEAAGDTEGALLRYEWAHIHHGGGDRPIYALLRIYRERGDLLNAYRITESAIDLFEVINRKEALTDLYEQREATLKALGRIPETHTARVRTFDRILKEGGKLWKYYECF